MAGVGDAHAVVHLEPLAQAAQNGNGVLHVGLFHQHGLETAFKGRILLDVLAVLVERGRADAVQLAARQHGLEDVARVHGPVGLARAHDGVHLVDEHDDLPGGLGHLLEHGLEPLLELAPILGPGDERGHVEGKHGLVLEPLGHVLFDDALGQPLGNGRLAHARLADEHRIVLGAAGQDADDAADLGIAANDRIELARTGLLHQVATVLLERIIGRLGIVRGHALLAAHLFQRLRGPCSCPGKTACSRGPRPCSTPRP